MPAEPPINPQHFLVDAFRAFLPVLGIAVVFGFVYWLVRHLMERKAKAKREAWIAERRANRGSEPKEPPGRV